MDDQAVIQLLVKRVEEVGTQTATAEAMGISLAYLNDIIKGRRNITPAILDKLGLVRVSFYVPTAKEGDVRGAVEKAMKVKVK